MKVEVNWISFSERSPEKKGIYLLETDDHGEAITGLFKDNKWYYVNINPKKEIEPKLLHWAKKPEIPKYISNKKKKDIDLNKRRAKFIYEGARLHAIQLGCPAIPKPWNKREQDFKAQFKELIFDLCSNKRQFQDFKEAHDSWVKKYFEMGWKYGKQYDPQNRIHPDLVSYNDLDPKEKVKDEVFVRLVNIAKDCIW